MNPIFRFVAVTVITIVQVSPNLVQAAPHSRLLDGDSALALLDRTLKRDRVYTNRISLDCVTYGTEEITRDYFQFVLRENHNAKCGGDPDTNPVVDRYRVNRRSGKIEWLEKIEGNWQPYNPSQIR
jgi:hypothetical protein